MSDENMQLLFAPKSRRGLRVDYPELAEYEEFKNIRAKELLFVWYYACKSSPFFNLDIRKRDLIQKCVDVCDLLFDDEARKEKFLSGNFPEKIQSANKQMEIFEPAARIEAKQMAIKMIADIKSMVSLPLDENGVHPSFLDKSGELDLAKKNAHMNMVFKANDRLGDMIRTAEKGFGVTERKKTIIDKNREASGETFAESYHDKN